MLIIARIDRMWFIEKSWNPKRVTWSCNNNASGFAPAKSACIQYLVRQGNNVTRKIDARIKITQANQNTRIIIPNQ